MRSEDALYTYLEPDEEPPIPDHPSRSLIIAVALLALASLGLAIGFWISYVS